MKALFTLLMSLITWGYAQRSPLERLSAQIPVATKRFVLDGNRYPDVVDLGNQFPRPPEEQEWGSCHAFAAVALFEAACVRAIRKQIDVSEAYLFYHHLRKKLLVKGSLLRPGQDREADYLPASLASGVADDTIGRIFEGQVCLERDLRFSNDFVPFLKGLLLSHSRQPDKDVERLRQRFIVSLDNKVQRHFPKAVRSWKRGVNFLADDPDLIACLERTRIANTFTPGRRNLAVKLLAAKIPFLCDAPIVYSNEKDTDNSRHSFIVNGYQYDPKSRRFSYFVRDSNYRHRMRLTPINDFVVCERMVAIETVLDPEF